MKHAKGEWKVCIQPSHGIRLSVRAYENNKSIEVCSVNSPGFLENRSSKPVAEANAKLIAEAGTVTNQTGKTPKQLADENKKLLYWLETATELFDQLRDSDAGQKLGISWRHCIKEQVYKYKQAINKATLQKAVNV